MNMNVNVNMNMATILQGNRVIAAVQQDQLAEAMDSSVCAILLMYAKLTRLFEQASIAQSSKPLFLHADLIKGLSGDKEAFRFLAEHIKPTGIVTTKGPMIRAAKKEGLLTIQRIFLIDSNSLQMAISSVQENQPDAIEIMPGLAPAIIPYIKQRLQQPIILGGLLWSKEQVDEALKHGADAVSLSKEELWNR